MRTYLSEETSLRVELLDDRDRPIAGYSGKHAAIVKKGGLRQPVIWPSTGTAEVQANEPFVVKVSFSDQGTAWLYAIYVEPGSEVAPQEVIRKLTTDRGVEFGIWGRREGRPQPTLIVLGSTIDQTLGSEYYRQCGNQLARGAGWLCVSIDLPCHGKEVREGESAGLSGWRQRAEAGEDFVALFNQRLSAVLDYLIENRYTKAHQIAVCGTSRGGFLAIQFAAADRRVGAAAGFAPVTDLAALNEFRGVEQHSMVQKLSLANQATALADRHVWIGIGDQDQRVSTDRAIELARALTTAKSKAQFHLFPEPRGHTTPKGALRNGGGLDRIDLQPMTMKAKPNPSVARSYELYERACKLIPGGVQLLSRRPSRFAEGVSPVYAVSAKGARFTDVDGNEYIDWVSGIGAIILGYADPVVDEAVKEQIGKGTIYAINHQLEIELAEEIVGRVPCAEMVRYAKCGGEACAMAVRIARKKYRREPPPWLPVMGAHPSRTYTSIVSPRARGVDCRAAWWVLACVAVVWIIGP